MNKIILYENIIKNISKSIKNILNEASTLNNVNAYRFIQIYVVKAIKMTLGENNAILLDIPQEIKMRLKIGRTTKITNILLYYNFKNTLAISQAKMLYTKNIAFICDNNIYIINGDLLRANWSNNNACKILKNTYNDALKEKSLMTEFNIEFLKNNAENIIPLTDDAAIMYNNAYEKMNII